ncbi:MAG: capsule assembly Wzi family protein [Pseudomonadota bacterium]|uniref:capsule assembly Wzi family protein n=1 Tax=Gallaecimonas pentaromativorans TaxID=584787 RepID=UPI00067F17B1|nr:capsule assembly Wzi family protein [Gallaecimonas pentaromativorans]MED5526127.1 capsule assembly Wzi family protein [Pseudomonadota bacterium]
MLLRFSALATLVLVSTNAAAKGVSPYLPLNQSPEIERQIDRVLMLADDTVMTRPIAAARVLEALPKARAKDPELAAQVAHYLKRYMKSLSVTHADFKANLNHVGGQDVVIPNQRGQSISSNYEASFTAIWQPSDYALVSLGGVSSEDNTTPTNSFVSLGFDWAQLDIGYRDHWLSPMHDSAMLYSTESETRPSITLSNYQGLTDFNIRYELFYTELTSSNKIAWGDGYTTGRPRLVGVHLSFEPVSGLSLGFNRIMQFGGGARGGNSLKDITKAFFDPTGSDNVGQGVNNTDQEQGNQAASFTAKMNFQGRIPFQVYGEYAGEDTSKGASWRLGNVATSAGIYFPEILPNLDVTFETAEWQNDWYTHHIYGDGLSNSGVVVGNWAAQYREFGNRVGGQSNSIIVNWEFSPGQLLQTTYRTVKNHHYDDISSPNYKRAQQLELRYSTSWNRFIVGSELYLGRDVYGDTYSSLGAFIRW